MSTINGRVCIVNGTPVDKVFSDGRQVYGRNLICDTSFELGIWKNIWSNPAMSITTDGNLKFTIPDNNQAGVGVTAESLGMGIYTLTAKVRGRGPLQPYVMYWDIGNYDIYTNNGMPHPIINSDTDFVDIKYTFDLKGKDPAKQYAFAVLTIDGEENWLEIKKDSLKVEYGTVDTPYSPAPEDVLNGYIAAPRNLTATVIDVGTEKLDWE